MPMIANLPAATVVTATDRLPIEQASGTNAVSVAALFAGTQPAILAPTGSLLGRLSLGAGGPEAISLGSGLALAAGTLSVSGTVGQGLVAPSSGNTVTTLAGTDLVAAFSGGGDVWVTLTNLLDGDTVDALQPAVPAADTDSWAIDQGGNTLVRQTQSAVWTYMLAKLPTVKKRVVELTTDTVLDATSHNDAILVCSQPLALTASFATIGAGFACDVINLSAGGITMGSGIVTGSGAALLPVQAAARLLGIAYSGGSFAFWPGVTTSDDGSTGTPPANAVTIAAPGDGTVGVGFALSGTVSPAGDGVNVALAPSATIMPTSGWVAATVVGGNWTGSLTATVAGTYFAWVSDTTVGTTAVSDAIAVAASTSGGGATVTWGLEPSGSYAVDQTGIGVNAVLDPGAAAPGLQFGWSALATVAPTTWTAGVLVNTQSNGDTLWGTYLNAPATAGTWFCWAETTDAAASTVSAAITVT